MLFLTSCNFVENTSTIKELLPLISPLIVILLFGIERYLSYKIRKKEREILSEKKITNNIHKVIIILYTVSKVL